MFLSILVPIFNERENIPLLQEKIRAAMDATALEYEVVYVDDRSTDGSDLALDAIAAADARVKVLHFRRNCGQTAALMAGIQHSRGDILVPMDGDLQNDPEDIPRLIAKLEEGYEVVSGWRKQRQDDAFTRKLPSLAANWLISKMLGLKLHDYGCTLKAYRREVLEDVNLYGEMHRYIPVYALMEGARVAELPVNHHARQFGKSKYGLSRVFKVLLDILVVHFLMRMLDRPMHFFGRIGLSSVFAAFPLGLWALYLKYFADTSLIQTPLPLLVVFLALSGLLMILIGLLAEVQMRIYYEGRGRPPYSIKRKVNFVE